MTLERTHSEQIEYDAQQHEQGLAVDDASRKFQLAMVDAEREVDLAKIAADRATAESALTFAHESQRSWRKGRLRLIFILVGGWLFMVIVTLFTALRVKEVADNLALFIALITIVGAVSVPASAILYSQGYTQAQRGRDDE